jgi:hypothetical protein
MVENTVAYSYPEDPDSNLSPHAPGHATDLFPVDYHLQHEESVKLNSRDNEVPLPQADLDTADKASQ